MLTIIITSSPGLTRLDHSGSPRSCHLVPTVRDRGRPGARERPGGLGGSGGPRRQGGSESRPGCLRRVEALRRHRQSGCGLGTHGDPAIQEYKKERPKAWGTHRPAEPHATRSGDHARCLATAAAWRGALWEGSREATRDRGGGGRCLGKAGYEGRGQRRGGDRGGDRGGARDEDRAWCEASGS